MRVEKVWLSSLLHIEKFNKISEGLSWWKQLFKIQKIDKSFPQIDINGRSVPITFYSYGSIEIDIRGLSFSSYEPERSQYLNFINLDHNQNFTLLFSEMEEVTLYRNPTPYSEKFNYPWIKIEMKKGDNYLFSSRLERYKIEEGLEVNDIIYKSLINNVA